MNYRQILLGIFICIFAEFAVYNINHKFHFFKPLFYFRNATFREVRENKGSFTNPLLECAGMEDDESLGQMSISKYDLSQYVNKISKEEKIGVSSVYIRDLNNGPWVGVNESETFIGGSLLKVPILMANLKKAEDDNSFLDKKIVFDAEKVGNDQYFTSSNKMEIGKEYSVSDLIRYMVDYSDNNAANLLSKDLTPDEFNDVFESLGFGRPDINKPFPVDIKTYSGFFRVLYNASYLNKEFSEKALKTLSQVEFDRGIVKYLPNNIIVSHKFGVRTDDDINQLHDCGIVYYPKHPYLLCIMTKNGSFDNMAEAIAKISEYIYVHVNSKSSD